MSQDTTRTIHRSAASFFSGTMLSRITGLMRDVAMAYAFGTDSLIAIFMVAFRFAHLIRRLFGEGSLQNTFIPHFEELRIKNPLKAFTFFKDLSTSLILLLAGLIVIAMGTLSLMLYLFSWGETTDLLLKLTVWMLPSLLFICMYGLNAALLECEKKYFIPSLAPVAFNLVWILAALLLSGLSPLHAVFGLSIAVIVACAAQWAFTLPLTIECFKNAQIPLSLNLAPFSPDVKKLFLPLLLANLGVAASQINNALDPLFALYASGEGPAWLWYSIRIEQLPIALFGIAISGAVLPPLSRAIKNGDLEKFHHFYQFAKRKMALLTLPITAGIFATAPTCVNLLYGRGHFGMESVQGTSLCLLAYGVGLFPMAFVLVAAPALYAFNDFKTPMRSAIITMLINIVLNTLCIFVFHWGAASVALATSLASFWNAWNLERSLQKHIQTPSDTAFFSTVNKIFCISIVAILAVWSFDFFVIGAIPALQLMSGKTLTLSQNIFSEMGLFGAEALVFLGVIGMGAYLSGFSKEDFVG